MAYSDWSNKQNKKKKKYSSYAEWSNEQKGIVEEDIAPVKTRMDLISKTRVHPTVRNKKDDDRKWFQKGAFEDGLDWSDIPKVILGTKIDALENLGTGIIGMGEKIVDGFATIAPYLAQTDIDDTGAKDMVAAFNPEMYKEREEAKRKGVEELKEDVTEFVAKDLYDEEKVAKTIISAPVKSITGVDAESDSVLGEKSDSLLQSAGQLGATAALQAAGVPWWLTTGVTSYGGEVEGALNEGATLEQAAVSGLISAGSEILTEKISGGISFGGKTLDDSLTKVLSRNITDKTVRYLHKIGFDMAGEGAEEVLSGVMGALGQKLTYANDKEMSELFSSEEALESFIGGAVLGGVGSSVQAVKSNKAGVDYVTELTETEQKVVDKVYNDRLAEAEENGKVTQKQKAKIYDSVLNDLEKGYITTDTIESVLGGETYKSYKDTVDSEEALKQELDELRKMKNGERNDIQNDRLAELKGMNLEDTTKRDGLRKQLTQEMFGLVGNSRLAESYNEQTRRGQYFEADLSKYDKKYQDIIQKAIDSKVLNNTNRTHELVDMIAKISADKGVSFDFTNNEKLKASGFAKDGVTVNGFVTKDGITLNVNSAKYLNRVVGHEISHVLEGTELYTELQNTLFEYAKTKKDYQGRVDSLTELYKDVEGADINAELTADLVGDYLFTDSDFITKLSTEHRNVFQKIYDEIKYLYKVATAGSKEARELEKVKRAFDKAYKESGKVTDTKYSLTDSNGNKLTKEQGEHFKNSVVRDENGNLKVMYHGTSRGGFTVFDTYGSNYGLFGVGSYFTDNKSVAESYTNKGKGNSKQVYETYLNITNPMDMDAQANPEEWKKAFPDTDFPESGTNEAFYRAVEEFYSDQWMSKWEVAESIQATIESGMGYDGITHIGGGRFNKADPTRHRVYIAFQPEQIKSVDNTNPTKNPDIRYSLSEDSDGNRLTVKQSEHFKNSKMRDDNGNLKVMYHGSQDAGFHVFDPSVSDDGLSLFFVDRNDVAASYSGTSETYEAQTIRTAEDMNRFIESIGAEGYEVIEKDGKFILLYEGDRVADSNTAHGIYDEFCWYEGVGEGDANYKVYLNLKNPLEIDAKGRPWNKIDAEFSQETYDNYRGLTPEEKAALVDLAEWEDFRIFNSEIQEARDNALARAYEKMGEDTNIYDLFSVASDNFSEDSMRENARKYLKTRDFAQRAKEQGYDGVIFNNIVDNGGYSNGDEGASTVAIAFKPEQVKSVANTNPTADKDIRFSLSPAVQKRFANSKAVDENGDLKVLYHGTATGEFSIFDKAKGSVEGDYGSGFYFTDNEADVSEHYEGGGPDFDNKVDRRAEQIYNEALDEDNEISYEEAERRAREELYKGSHKFEVYLNIENPAVVGETNLLGQDKYLEEYNEEDYEDYDDYIADVEQLVADDIEGIVWEIERNVDVDSADGIADILYEAYYDGGIGLEQLKAKVNNLYLEDSEGNLVGNEVTRQIIESLGYDGIIDPTVAGKWNMDIEPGTTHYIVFKPNQIKAITNQNPTDDPDIHRSLSREGEQPKRFGNFNISGKDVAFPTKEAVKDLAPIKETKEALPDDYAPITEQEAVELSREMLESIDDSDVPPERQTDYHELPDTSRLDKEGEDTLVKSLKDVLSLDGKETAEMREVVQRYSTAEFPSKAELFDEIRKKFGERTWTTKDETAAEVKHYLRTTKVQLSDTIKNDIPNYNTFRKKNCFGKVRINNEGVPVDSLYMELTELYPGFFPADIINPTEQFMQMVNVANADTDIVEGYKLVDDEVQAIVNLISSEVSRYKEEGVMKAAEEDRQAFMNDVASREVAPTKETPKKAYEAIKPKPTKSKAQPEEEKIAKLLPPKTEAPKENDRMLSRARIYLGDKQAPIEDLSLKTGNRELMAKADYLHRVGSAAQRFIGKGTDGVRGLMDIKAEVEKAGLYEDFKAYMHDLLNVDRMSIESNAKKKIEKLQNKFTLTLKHNQIQAIAATKITKKTTPKTAQTIREAREYLDLLNARNKPVFGKSITADISRARVAKAEARHPQFKQWAKDIYGITEHLRKMLVDGDVISQETADMFAEIYPHYIPIKRSGKDGAAVNVALDTRKTGVNAPIKRATGGNSDIEDMFETLASRIQQTYTAVARNSLGIEMKKALGAEGIKTKTTVDKINESFDNHEELLKKGENGMNPTFTIFENGERVEFDITEDLYDSLKPKNDFLAKKLKPLNTAMKIQRGILTEYNLLFTATNAIKDAQSVMVNSQHPVETYMNVPKAVAELTTHALTGKNGRYLKEYFEHGGEDLSYFDSKNKMFKKEDAGIKKWLGLVPRAISEANNFIEKIPRLAEYIASRKNGASVEVAMLDAARVTTNFAAGGEFTKFLNNNGITFLNASVEGFNQQVRNVREAKAKGLKGMLQLGAKYAAAGLPVMLLNHLLWDDDEDYEELSDYIKDNYYIVAKTQDGKFIRIPKGREVAVIQNAFEQMKNLITGDDDVDMWRFGELLVENIAPNNPLTNNIFAPIFQAHTNTTWYGGELVPTRLQDVPLAEQHDESTDAISKWLGEKLNLSPYRLNYMLDQYSGGIGDIFLPMLTPESDGGGLLAPVKDKFTTDSTMKNQNVSDFYDTKDKLTANANSINATEEDILKSKFVNSVNSEVSELYQQKRDIQNSSLSDKEKYERVRFIQDQINRMTKEALNGYNSVYIEGDYAKVGDYRPALHFRKNADGEWEKITDKQLEKQQDVTSGLGISSAEYWSNKAEYDFAYESPEKYQVARAVGGYEAYKTYSSELYDIKADKDENGKSISGSRKEKVLDYINNLDADYGEKIILFKSEYNADDTYNYEIIDYLNSRDDISWEEMATILKELGFTVSSDGTISWD